MLKYTVNMQTIDITDFKFPGQKAVYHGKVRDLYDLGDKIVFVTSDRYSAFDRVLAKVPYKGELLTAISNWWFDQTKSIIKNHIITTPDPNVMIVKKYKVVPIEMVVRGYMTGVTNTSLWHNYSVGQRDFGDFTLPDGLKKNHKLPRPVFTHTTKFEEHDRNLTPAEAVSSGLVEAKVWEQLQKISLELFEFGQKTAASKGLVLVDTKYEFGQDENGKLVLIDEIHPPDSSRYWSTETYQASLDTEQEPENYDKEFLRLWFKERFDPYKDTEAPEVFPEIITELSNRYIYVYEHLTGRKFKAANTSQDVLKRIETNVSKVLKELK